MVRAMQNLKFLRIVLVFSTVFFLINICAINQIFEMNSLQILSANGEPTPQMKYTIDSNGYYWQIHTLDYIEWGGRDSSMVLDEDDLPHISYSTETALRYAHWNSSVWTIETIVTNDQWDYYNSIALNSENVPHIVYSSVGLPLYYTTKFNSKWTKEVIDSGSGYSANLVIDNENIPHIFYKGANQTVRYASRIDNVWNIKIIDSNVTSYGLSIDIKTSNLPHLSYCDRKTNQLKYAHFNGTSWSIEELNPDDRAYSSTVLRLDSNSRPHIYYIVEINDDRSDLRYALKNNGNWSFKTIEEDSSGTHFELDSHDNPHLIYNGYYVEGTDGGWIKNRLEADGPLTGVKTLKLDTLDQPNILFSSYMEEDEGYLKYGIKYVQQPPTSEQITGPNYQEFENKYFKEESETQEGRYYDFRIEPSYMIDPLPLSYLGLNESSIRYVNNDTFKFIFRIVRINFSKALAYEVENKEIKIKWGSDSEHYLTQIGRNTSELDFGEEEAHVSSDIALDFFKRYMYFNEPYEYQIEFMIYSDNPSINNVKFFEHGNVLNGTLRINYYDRIDFTFTPDYDDISVEHYPKAADFYFPHGQGIKIYPEGIWHSGDYYEEIDEYDESQLEALVYCTPLIIAILILVIITRKKKAKV